MKLNIGCGNKILQGYVNIDIIEPAPVIKDCNKTPYSYYDSSVEEILLNHVVEHFNNYPALIYEWYRILKKGGIIKIMTPYFSSPAFWGDLTHKKGFNVETFDRYSHLFKIEKYCTVFSNKGFMKGFGFVPNLFYQRFLSYIFPVSEIHFKLVKK